MCGHLRTVFRAFVDDRIRNIQLPMADSVVCFLAQLEFLRIMRVFSKYEYKKEKAGKALFYWLGERIDRVFRNDNVR